MTVARYPSKLPAHVQDKATSISIEAIKGLGLTNTTFNIEYFYNAKNDDLKIIEVNPRFSGQFGDIYEKVCYQFDL
jgi:carbamoylphosphate synthase large subunit